MHKIQSIKLSYYLGEFLTESTQVELSNIMEELMRIRIELYNLDRRTGEVSDESRSLRVLIRGRIAALMGETDCRLFDKFIDYYTEEFDAASKYFYLCGFEDCKSLFDSMDDVNDDQIIENANANANANAKENKFTLIK